MSLPAGTDCPAEVTCSRKQGDRGKGDYERPLREGAHRSRPPAIFDSFHRWKEHSSLSAPQGGTPEAKRSFAQSSFAYFSFKKSRAYFFLEKSKAQSQGNRAAGPTFNPAAWRISFTP